MSMTVGRASLTTDPSSISYDGDTLTLGFDILPSTLAEAKALRQQILGLANNADEPVIPVTWSGDSDLDGFYRVESVSVAPEQTYLFNNLMRASVTLERVGGGFTQPRVEVSSGLILRTNGQSITTPQGIMRAAPSNEVAVDWTTLTNQDTVTRPTSDGNDMFVVVSDAPETLTFWRYWPTVDEFYVGSALLEVKLGGAWYTVVGRHLAGLPSAALGDAWRISNGIVRLTAYDFNTSTGGTLEYWDDGAAAWDSFSVGLARWNGSTVADIQIGSQVSGTTTLPFAVLRNSPERVVVQTSDANQTIAYSLTRGAQHVEVLWSAPSEAIALGADIKAAATAVTAGIRSTSASGDGNYLVAAVAAADSSDLTNGYVYPTAAATASNSIMIGATATISGEPAANNPAALVEQFLAISPIHQSVESR